MLFRSGAIGTDDLRSSAREVGLDAAAFDRCLDSGQHSAAVQRDLENALGQGLQGTPTFVVNGQPLMGLQPLEAFQELIDPLLNSGG